MHGMVTYGYKLSSLLPTNPAAKNLANNPKSVCWWRELDLGIELIC